MPYVDVQVTRGVTREQKAEVVSDITDTLVRVLGNRGGDFKVFGAILAQYHGLSPSDSGLGLHRVQANVIPENDRRVHLAEGVGAARRDSRAVPEDRTGYRITPAATCDSHHVVCDAER